MSARPIDRVREFLRQREMGKGNDPEVIGNIWFDPDSEQVSLTVSDLRAILPRQITTPEELAAEMSGTVVRDFDGVVYISEYRDADDQFPWRRVGTSQRYSNLAVWLPADVIA